ICELFLQNDNSNLDLMGMGAFTCDAIWTSALFHLAIGSRCQDYVATMHKVVPWCIDAIEIMSDGGIPLPIQELKKALQRPHDALQMLQLLP
ncbi:hypothetical protein HDU91_003395, partial [Kappamyces sp. JEL0680]